MRGRGAAADHFFFFFFFDFEKVLFKSTKVKEGSYHK